MKSLYLETVHLSMLLDVVIKLWHLHVDDVRSELATAGLLPTAHTPRHPTGAHLSRHGKFDRVLDLTWKEYRQAERMRREDEYGERR